MQPSDTTRWHPASLGARNWQFSFQLRLVQRWTPLSETLPCLGEVSESYGVVLLVDRDS